MTSRFQIEHVEAAVVRPLRHEVLRSGLPAVTTEFRGDDHPLAAHIAVSDVESAPPGEIVSVGTVFPNPPPWEWDRRGAWRIRGMATREGLRGLGLGRGVLDGLVEHAITHGGSLVWCHAHVSALAFYHRSGFVPIGGVFDNGVAVHQSMLRTFDGQAAVQAHEDSRDSQRAGAAMSKGRKVQLRRERDGADSRYLWAYLDDEGNLHIDGQDLGPGTAPVSADGEYEWFKTIRAEEVPKVVTLLGGHAGEDVLDLLEACYTGRGSYELEKRLRESDIKVKFHSY